MNDYFEIVFPVLTLIAIGSIVLVLIKTVYECSRYNSSPVQTVSARIIMKKTCNEPLVHCMAKGHACTTVNTKCYVTFQMDSGEVVELAMSYGDYRHLPEVDVGKLTFRGNRYYSFKA